MKKLPAVFLTSLMILIFTLAACQKTGNGSSGTTDYSLEGVWKIEEANEIDSTGAATNMEPQRSLIIFSGNHYSFVWTSGSEPRKLSTKHWNTTDAEKIDAYRTLVVNTGTYELTESQLITRPQVAKVEEFVGGHATYDCRIEGNTVVLEMTELVSVEGASPTSFLQGGKDQFKLVRVDDSKQ